MYSLFSERTKCTVNYRWVDKIHFSHWVGLISHSSNKSASAITDHVYSIQCNCFLCILTVLSYYLPNRYAWDAVAAVYCDDGVSLPVMFFTPVPRQYPQELHSRANWMSSETTYEAVTIGGHPPPNVCKFQQLLSFLSRYVTVCCRIANTVFSSYKFSLVRFQGNTTKRFRLESICRNWFFE